MIRIKKNTFDENSGRGIFEHESWVLRPNVYHNVYPLLFSIDLFNIYKLDEPVFSCQYTALQRSYFYNNADIFDSED